ncbi:MAG: nicotinamide-nucleotide amidohydrolase family protein [Opitutae bacterium]|nr:nicotinamide-nucleotide amidohydrolase family protein [Opitutae bacterium]
MANSESPLPKRTARYELITLGDELLLGLTPNSHLTFIGAQLGRRGILLQRNITITDDADAIAAQFRESWARADVVITTGGLGPTCDDRTREVLAEVLGQPLVLEPGIVAHIEARFAQFNRKMTPNNLKQAYRFERGEALPNPNGTAPGLWVEQDGKVLVMLPGPPNELQPMFTDTVMPRLTRLELLTCREAYLQLCTAGVGESALETKFQPVFDRYPGLGVAYCAHPGQVDVVSYSNDAKMLLLDCPECLLSQHGAVSAECAVAMACGVAEQLGADFGLAVTGFAGPAGGAGENPVGTIYLGLHAPGGDWSKKLTYPGPRCAVKERAVTAAIDWLRREVVKEAHQAATVTMRN